MTLLFALRPVVAVTALLPALHAGAQTLNFDVTAEILASTCDISAGDLSRDIDLPQVNVNAFPTGGTTAGHRDFTLTLVNCPASLSSATFTFSGTADAASPLHFANTGTASAFALQLSSRPDGQIIGTSGASSTRTAGISGGQATLDLRASYWHSGRPPQGGTLVSHITFEMTYL